MTKKFSLALVSIFVLTVLSALLGANGPVNHSQEAARLNNLGAAYMNQELFEKALKAFEAAAAKNPALKVAGFNREIPPITLKKFAVGIASFEGALKIDPLHASAQFGLARAYQQSGNADSAREAMKRFQYVSQNKLGIPISLTYGEQGKYSRAKESPLAVRKVPAEIDVKFADVTKEAGIVARIGAQTGGSSANWLGPGACFFDYDNDGNIDLLLADNRTQGGMSLYHNLGSGKFEDVTKSAGLDRYGPAISC